MRAARAPSRLGLVQLFAEIWKNWLRRRARLFEFDRADPAELQRIARDLNVSTSELRELVGHNENSADLLRRRLQNLDVNPAAIEPAVMHDLQRSCSQCGLKVLCEHELEDRPIAASWPRYCPNEQTIDALVAEKARDCH